MKTQLLKSLLTAFLMLFAWGTQAQTSTRLYIDDFTIEHGESKELKVMFTGDVYITQVQFTIALPEGFEFEMGQKVRTNATTLIGLPQGIYVVN